MGLADELGLARVIGNIYTEVFQRRQPSDNVIFKTRHALEDQNLNEATFTVLHSNATIWVWGQSGSSNHTDSSPLQGVWGEGFWS